MIEDKYKAIPTLADLSYKLLCSILKENISIMQELNNANDELLSKSPKLDSNTQRYSSISKSKEIHKAIQTELEGNEIKMIAEMLEKRETEASKLTSDLKKNKVYTKLCENKIRTLEQKLNKYFRVQIDENLIEDLKIKVKNMVSEKELQWTRQCLFYPNPSFFKNNSKFHKAQDFIARIKAVNNTGKLNNCKI